MTWNKILPAAVAAAFLMSAGAASANEPNTQDQASDQGQVSGGTDTTFERSDEIPKSEQRTLTLTVKNVDRANNRVEFEAQVDPEATVKRGSEELRINQLQPGDSVRASFDPTTGEVQSMEVIEPGTKEPGMQPPSSMEPSPSPGMEEPSHEPGMGEPGY